jgi:hypothetical protein
MCHGPRRAARHEEEELEREGTPQQPRPTEPQLDQGARAPAEDGHEREEDEDRRREQHGRGIGGEPLGLNGPGPYGGGRLKDLARRPIRESKSPQGAASDKEKDMKAQAYRIAGSATVVTVLTLVLGAPKKWG